MPMHNWTYAVKFDKIFYISMLTAMLDGIIRKNSLYIHLTISDLTISQYYY